MVVVVVQVLSRMGWAGCDDLISAANTNLVPAMQHTSENTRCNAMQRNAKTKTNQRQFKLIQKCPNTQQYLTETHDTFT